MTFQNIRITGTGNTVSFDIQQGNHPIDNATIMIPSIWGSKSVVLVQENGAAQEYSIQTIDGISYALFTAFLIVGETKSYIIEYR